MSHADPDRWQSLPGNFDTVNARLLFPANNAYDMPVIRRAPLSATPAWLVPYGVRLRPTADSADLVWQTVEGESSYPTADSRLLPERLDRREQN